MGRKAAGGSQKGGPVQTLCDGRRPHYRRRKRKVVRSAEVRARADSGWFCFSKQMRWPDRCRQLLYLTSRWSATSHASAACLRTTQTNCSSFEVMIITPPKVILPSVSLFVCWFVCWQILPEAGLGLIKFWRQDQDLDPAIFLRDSLGDRALFIYILRA